MFLAVVEILEIGHLPIGAGKDHLQIQTRHCGVKIIVTKCSILIFIFIIIIIFLSFSFFIFLPFFSYRHERPVLLLHMFIYLRAGWKRGHTLPTDMVCAVRAFDMVTPIDFLNRSVTSRAFVDVIFLFPFRECFFGLHSGLVCFATYARVIMYLAVYAYDIQAGMA